MTSGNDLLGAATGGLSYLAQGDTSNFLLAGATGALTPGILNAVKPPKVPPLPPSPKAPTASDADTQKAAEAARLAAAQAYGRGATILTSPLGYSSAPSLGKKTLLGGPP